MPGPAKAGSTSGPSVHMGRPPALSHDQSREAGRKGRGRGVDRYRVDVRGKSRHTLSASQGARRENVSMQRPRAFENLEVRSQGWGEPCCTSFRLRCSE